MMDDEDRNPKRRGDCVHCDRVDVILFSTRDLCRECYKDQQVRDLYAVENKMAHQANRVISKGPTKRPQPTTAVPGSLEKIKVLAERLARGEALWHPDDADMSGANPRDYVVGLLTMREGG